MQEPVFFGASISDTAVSGWGAGLMEKIAAMAATKIAGKFCLNL